MSVPPIWAIFGIVGVAFLLLAVGRCWRARQLGPQARAWFIVGTVFCLVAAWLGSRASGPP